MTKIMVENIRNIFNLLAQLGKNCIIDHKIAVFLWSVVKLNLQWYKEAVTAVVIINVVGFFTCIYMQSIIGTRCWYLEFRPCKARKHFYDKYLNLL